MDEKDILKLKKILKVLDDPAGTFFDDIERIDGTLGTLLDNQKITAADVQFIKDRITSQELLNEIAALVYVTPGEKGEKGDRGEAGQTGKDGKNGKDGRDGRDGRDGQDGIGRDGNDGNNGMDGSPDTGEQIIEKINSLPEGSLKIVAEHISGIESVSEFKRLLDVISHRTEYLLNRNAVTSVNGQTGALVLSIGSLTTFFATETPDPNNDLKVFTFPGATAQPSFIVADYAQKPPTAASGAILWTWNNSTKQATLTTAPNEDIYAIK